MCKYIQLSEALFIVIGRIKLRRALDLNPICLVKKKSRNEHEGRRIDSLTNGIYNTSIDSCHYTYSPRARTPDQSVFQGEGTITAHM